MRQVIALVLLLTLSWCMMSVLRDVPFGADRLNVSHRYLDKGPAETGAANIVTAIVVNYRGFDTLGEVTVLFASALGIALVLANGRKKQEESSPARATPTPPSLVVRTGVRILFPLILLFGAYIFVHGHLTPGGGFQGGAVIASAFLLLYLAGADFADRTTLGVAESLGGLVFVTVGFLGMTFGSGFLSNYLPVGTLNNLLSAGIIPIIYIAIGVKVGAELTGIVGDMMEGE